MYQESQCLKFGERNSPTVRRPATLLISLCDIAFRNLACWEYKT